MLWVADFSADDNFENFTRRFVFKRPQERKTDREKSVELSHVHSGNSNRQAKVMRSHCALAATLSTTQLFSCFNEFWMSPLLHSAQCAECTYQACVNSSRECVSKLCNAIVKQSVWCCTMHAITRLVVDFHRLERAHSMRLACILPRDNLLYLVQTSLFLFPLFRERERERKIHISFVLYGCVVCALCDAFTLSLQFCYSFKIRSDIPCRWALMHVCSSRLSGICGISS